MPEDVMNQEPAPQGGAPADQGKAPQGGAPAEPQKGTPQKGTPQEGGTDLEARLRELEKERERLQKELERIRKEAAERRVTAKTLEERVAELEKLWQEAQRQAKLAETRARLYAVIGSDEARVNAALALMEREGLEDPNALLERYPFLRSAPPAPGPANPGSGARRLTASEIARMSPEEYARRRAEILQAMARGEIAPE